MNELFLTLSIAFACVIAVVWVGGSLLFLWGAFAEFPRPITRFLADAFFALFWLPSIAWKLLIYPVWFNFRKRKEGWSRKPPSV